MLKLQFLLLIFAAIAVLIPAVLSQYKSSAEEETETAPFEEEFKDALKSIKEAFDIIKKEISAKYGDGESKRTDIMVGPSMRSTLSAIVGIANLIASLVSTIISGINKS